VNNKPKEKRSDEIPPQKEGCDLSVFAQECIQLTEVPYDYKTVYLVHESTSLKSLISTNFRGKTQQWRLQTSSLANLILIHNAYRCAPSDQEAGTQQHGSARMQTIRQT